MNRARPQTENRKRCRSELLWLVGVFVLLQAGLAAGVHVWLKELRDPIYFCRADRLQGRVDAENVAPLTIVMLGSSRTAFGFRGGLVESKLGRTIGRPVVTCNLGCCGTAHLNELIFLQRLLARGVHPDLLLVEVTPPMLAGQPYAPREVDWLQTSRFTWEELQVLQQYSAHPGDLQSEWLKSLPVPWYTRRFEILSWLSPQWVPVRNRIDWGTGGDDSGWGPHSVRDRSFASYQRAFARTRQEYESFLAWFQVSPSSAGPLLDLLQLCRAKQVHTALVLMPEGSDFRALYPPFAWPKIHEFLDVLFREFNVPVINAREWVTDSAFSDSHHLLPEGATTFTERLCRETLIPLFRQHQAN
jgi:hypothetical protein